LGLGIGGATPPLASLIAEFFGLRSVGIITGLIGVGWAAGCSLGTVIGDVIFDATGSYFAAFLLGIGLAVAAAIMAVSLRHPKPLPERSS
jgi:MFS family permease